MSDLISRQDAIDAIKTMPIVEALGAISSLPSADPHQINIEEYAHDMEISLAQAEKELQVYPWIPCSERLPEENTEVLITDEDGDLAIAEYYLLHDSYIEWWSSSHRIFPIAWMELPEPYKEEIK